MNPNPFLTVRPPAMAGGGLRSSAEVTRRAGTGPDRNLVHLSDRELDLLSRTWGPPERNPHTGLPAYGFFDSILSGLGDVVSALPVVGQVVGPLLGAAQAFMGPGRATTGYGPGQGYNDSTYGPAGGAGADSGGGFFSQLGAPTRPGGFSDLATGILGFIGNLAASREREKQQKKLQQQQTARYNDFMGPHVNYNFGTPTSETIGLTPSRSTALAGLYPEEQLIQTRPLPYAQGGGVHEPGIRPSFPRFAPPAPAPRLREPTLPLRPAATPAPRSPLLAMRPPTVLPDVTRVPARAMGGPVDYSGGGRTAGPGGGQDDKVPAYLSPDEYVLPADVVSHFGDGSSTAGAKRVDELVARVRRKRTGHDRFPPKGGGVLAQFARRAA